jgi:hypothetical protein
MGIFTKDRHVPTFAYRSEAFDYRFAELVERGYDLTDAAKEANEFAKIIAENKRLPDAPAPEMSIIEKGVYYAKQIADIKRENPDIWDMVTSVASGIIGGFAGGSVVALQEPQQTEINFDNLD